MSKKTFLAIIALLILSAMLCTSAFAESVPSSENEEQSDVSDSEASAITLEEPPNKKLEWAYWLIGFGAIAAVAASAVVISKKVK